MPTAARLLLLLALALAVCGSLLPTAAGAATAHQATAKVAAFRPVKAVSDTVIFRIAGIRSSSVQSGYLNLGRRNRPLAVRRIRLAVKRGVLRVRTPNGQASTRARLYVRSAVGSAPYVLPADAYHVSATGSDDNPGTAQLPWRTLGHAAGAAQPGQTVAIHQGSYSRPGQITRLERSGTPNAPITFVGMPGEELPRILGQLRIDGDYVRLRRVIADGPTGPVAATSSDNPGGEDVQLWIRGSHSTLADSEVRNSHWHAGVYVSEGAQDVSILRNHIHDNGNFGNPGQANLDHGIYWDSGSGRIAGNLVEHNHAYGVHLYPDASGVVVEGNTIRNNGRDGVIVSDRSSHNLIVGNLVTGNRLGIRSYDLTGVGNIVRGNQLSGNREGNLRETRGFILQSNITD
jgi:parallel beta-helix repeat protein